MVQYKSKGFLKHCIAAFIVLLNFSTVSKAVQPDSTFWWNDAVFYEVFVRSFKDSDGDGKGDFKGLIQKLDYLNDGDPNTHTDLGITAIWLMPIMQSPSYHGYDVIDYRTIEQDYGTNQDFKDFMTAAHDRGIKVIIDYVMNHTSSQHPWFNESINSLNGRRDWYVWQTPSPGGTGPWGQQLWYPQNSSNYYAIFWSGMPDLNYNKPEVKTEMFDIARFWLEDMDVDGFRLDAARYILESGTNLQDIPETIGFWEEFRTYYKSVNADAFAVGEAWAATSISKNYVSDTTLDYCFEFDLASAIINTANTGSTTGLYNKLGEVMSSYPYLQFGSFLTNHDQTRVMNTLGSSIPKAKIASDLLLTLPGIPYIYYGEEIGMTGIGVDENKRTPLQWSNATQGGFTTGTPWRPVNADYTTKNIKSQQQDQTSLWNNYRKLISLRNSYPSLRKGNYKAMTSSSTSVFTFVRQLQGENIVVISNTSGTALTNVQVSLSSAGITPGNYSMKELRGGKKLSVVIDGTGGFSNLTISSVPANSTLIYLLEDPLLTSVETSVKTSFNVYPVPTTNELFVEYSNGFSGTMNYKITDLVGAEQVVSSFATTGKIGKQRLSCEGLLSGVYLMTLSYGETSEVFKIVIQK